MDGDRKLTAPTWLQMDGLLERNARLAVALRRAIAAYHRAANHEGVWHKCEDNTCHTLRAVVEGQALEKAPEPQPVDRQTPSPDRPPISGRWTPAKGERSR